MPVPLIDAQAAELQTLGEIREWRLGVVDALVEQRGSVRRAIISRSNVPDRFVGMTEDDLDTHFDAQRRELDRLTVLNLVASAEAAIRVDYFRRVADRLKDALSVEYRSWHTRLSAARELRPDFDENGILDVLKQSSVMDNDIVGRFRECLRVRNWVGHGRYWAKPIEVDKLDPEEVFSRADAVLQSLPA